MTTVKIHVVLQLTKEYVKYGRPQCSKYIKIYTDCTKATQLPYFINYLKNCITYYDIHCFSTMNTLKKKNHQINAS
jgi:hypothetical protein